MKRPEDADAQGVMDFPFGSVLTGPALVTAVLFVAGFSYEWAFYYNFGLEYLARQLPTLSTAIAAFEVVRNAADALDAAVLLIVPQILLGAVSYLSETFSKSSLFAVRWLASTVADVLGAGNGIVRIALSAFLLVYAAAYAGSWAGTHAYRALAIETDNSLPRVTLFSTNGEIPIACEQHTGLSLPATDTQKPTAFIGSGSPLTDLKGGKACNLPGQSSWRLLYRDDKFIYLFQTLRSTDAGRPLTLVVPASDNLILILNGADGNG
jgi:hypothetical protein